MPTMPYYIICLSFLLKDGEVSGLVFGVFKIMVQLLISNKPTEIKNASCISAISETGFLL